MNGGKKPYLQNFIDEDLREFPDYPLGQIKDVIDLLERRRSKRIDNFVVLIAAVIGGIIGAMVVLTQWVPHVATAGRAV